MEEIVGTTEFIESRLNAYAEKIKTGSAKIDDHSIGEMTFFMALRRVLAGKGTPQDLGMMDAINDTLQDKGIVKIGDTFIT